MLKAPITITLFSLFCYFFLFTTPVQSQSEQKDEKQESSKDRVYPIYNGCAKFEGNNKKLKDCLNQKINNKIQQRLKRDVFTALKTDIQFNLLLSITKEGVIKLIEVSPYIPQYADEFIGIIKTLPKIKPGKINKQPVPVKIGLSIIMQRKPSRKTNRK